jgi:hypothetical protein
MKTKLLRKLRKEAHKRYGITYDFDVRTNQDEYIVERKDFSNMIISVFTTFNEAYSKLRIIRRRFILNEVQRLRKEKMMKDIKKKNKEYRKL